MEGRIASFKNIRWFMQKPQYGNVESFFSETVGKQQYLLFYETVAKQHALFYETVGKQQYPQSLFCEKVSNQQQLFFYETVGKQQYPQSLFYEKVGSQQQYQPKTHFNQVSQYELIITLLHYYFSMNHHGFIEENHLL